MAHLSVEQKLELQSRMRQMEVLQRMQMDKREALLYSYVNKPKPKSKVLRAMSEDIKDTEEELQATKGIRVSVSLLFRFIVSIFLFVLVFMMKENQMTIQDFDFQTILLSVEDKDAFPYLNHLPFWDNLDNWNAKEILNTIDFK